MTNDDATSIFRCANTRCGKPLDVDHTTLITTAHLRRFCSVFCVVEGHEAHLDSIWAEVSAQVEQEDRDRQDWLTHQTDPDTEAFGEAMTGDLAEQ